jgi:phospholipid transport system substrate-binding protein
MKFKPSALIAMTVAGLLAAPACPSFAAKDPAQFVVAIERQAVAILDNHKLPPTVNEHDFSDVVEQALDLPAIGRFTLGPYWRESAPAERRQFLAALGPYLVSVYWSSLQTATGDRFAIIGERPLDAATTLVATELIRPERGTVHLGWTVTTRGGRDKIIDLKIDGVSQALSERGQFLDLIARGGGSLVPLLDRMHAVTANLIA